MVTRNVDGFNRFKNFYGDTVVFDLDGGVKKKLAEYVDFLYGEAPECFCERLIDGTFHMTLHDLSSSASLREVGDELFYNELKVIEKAGEVCKYKKVKIKMKSKAVFNMVNTSLVLGLYPASDDDHRMLTGLYGIFDDVRKLNYPLTPHITLAYYNANGFGLDAARKLTDAVVRLNDEELETELSVDKLYYQKFKSMNDYANIVNLGRGVK